MINTIEYAMNLEIQMNGVSGQIDGVTTKLVLKPCSNGFENHYDLKTIISKTQFKQGSLITIGTDIYLVEDIEEQFAQTVYYKGTMRKCEKFMASTDEQYKDRYNLNGFVTKDTSAIVDATYFLEENSYINATIPENQYSFRFTNLLYKNYVYMVTSADNTKDGIRIVTAKKTISTYGIDHYTIELSTISSQNHIGDTIQLVATCKKNNVVVESPVITYLSQDISVATVTNGLITCIKDGIVKVTCTYEDVSAEYSLEVLVDSYEISLNSANGEIQEGTTYQLTPVCKKNNVVVENPSIVYVSSDETIATVDSTGTVSAIKNGSSTITCTYMGMNTTYTLSVSLGDVYLIESAISSISIERTKTTQLSPTVKLNGVLISNPTFTYTSSNPSIATIDSNGLVTGTGVGATSITIDYEDKATYTINISISELQVVYTINGVDSFHQKDDEVFTISPLRDCTFYISDFDSEYIANIISDDGHGTCMIYGKVNVSDNTFTLQAKDSLGNVIASKKIKVDTSTSTYTLDVDSSQLSLNLDETFTHQIVAICKRNGVVVSNPVVTYTSNNTSIATVDSTTGLITGVSLGSTSITATYRGITKTINTVVISNAPIEQVPFHLEATSAISAFAKGQQVTFKVYKDTGELYPNTDKSLTCTLTSANGSSNWGVPSIQYGYADHYEVYVKNINCANSGDYYYVLTTTDSTGYTITQYFFNKYSTPNPNLREYIDGVEVHNPTINLTVGQVKSIKVLCSDWGSLINNWFVSGSDIVTFDRSKLTSSTNDVTITALKAGTSIIKLQCDTLIETITINVV